MTLPSMARGAARGRAPVDPGAPVAPGKLSHPCAQGREDEGLGGFGTALPEKMGCFQ